jgi:hypothetical protein
MITQLRNRNYTVAEYLSTGQKTKTFLKPLIFGQRGEAPLPKNQGFQGFCPVLRLMTHFEFENT